MFESTKDLAILCHCGHNLGNHQKDEFMFAKDLRLDTWRSHVGTAPQWRSTSDGESRKKMRLRTLAAMTMIQQYSKTCMNKTGKQPSKSVDTKNSACFGMGRHILEHWDWESPAIRSLNHSICGVNRHEPDWTNSPAAERNFGTQCGSHSPPRLYLLLCPDTGQITTILQTWNKALLIFIGSIPLTFHDSVRQQWGHYNLHKYLAHFDIHFGTVWFFPNLYRISRQRDTLRAWRHKDAFQGEPRHGLWAHRDSVTRCHCDQGFPAKQSTKWCQVMSSDVKWCQVSYFILRDSFTVSSNKINNRTPEWFSFQVLHDKIHKGFLKWGYPQVIHFDIAFPLWTLYEPSSYGGTPMAMETFQAQRRGSRSSWNSGPAGPVAAARCPRQASRHSESQCAAGDCWWEYTANPLMKEHWTKMFQDVSRCFNS